MAIEKHGKVKAVVMSPQYSPEAGCQDARPAERCAARMSQAVLEKDRLVGHQRIAIDLLTLAAPEREALMQRARTVVERWRTDGLCSRDYIERWQALLALPPREPAVAMTSDADGWGAALRQNSPWSGMAR